MNETPRTAIVLHCKLCETGRSRRSRINNSFFAVRRVRLQSSINPDGPVRLARRRSRRSTGRMHRIETRMVIAAQGATAATETAEQRTNRSQARRKLIAIARNPISTWAISKPVFCI